jgi:hypothetical protein
MEKPTQEERKKQQAEMLAKRQAEIAENIAWWKQQEKWRIEGFNIVQADPMYIKMNEHYRQRKLEELL